VLQVNWRCRSCNTAWKCDETGVCLIAYNIHLKINAKKTIDHNPLLYTKWIVCTIYVNNSFAYTKALVYDM
jgi:hypothetical protein